jgi:excisionase family DNA binding protein
MTTTPALPRFFDVVQVAELLGVCPRTVRRFIKAGELQARRFGRQVRVSEEEYRRFVREH